MTDTYFNYVLSQCQTQGIASICKVVFTRKSLLEMANSGFNGCRDITANWRLLEAVKDCLNNFGIIDPNALGRDASEIYNRCKNWDFSEDSKNYDRFFDLLVEFNWLQASIHEAKNNASRYVDLLSDPIKIQHSLKEYLLDVYNSAVRDSNQCVYIDEAIRAKGKIFTGLFPFQYEESKYYASQNCMVSDLRVMQEACKQNSLKGMSLFLGLTATAALAENIRRGMC